MLNSSFCLLSQGKVKYQIQAFRILSLEFFNSKYALFSETLALEMLRLVCKSGLYPKNIYRPSFLRLLTERG